MKDNAMQSEHPSSLGQGVPMDGKALEETPENLSRLKNEFLANISHEIRTPLNGILGMTELVLDDELTTDQRDNLSLVKLSAESLIAAIDDVLDFSQIEIGKLEVEFIPFDFRESLGETMKMLGLRAERKGLELVYEIAPDIPEELVGDPGRIRRVIYNLVGNAIKFTESGEVLMLVQVHEVTSEGIYLHFEIKDTGIGIPADRQRMIFEPFSQADGSMTRKHGGMGLGLTIANRLVEMMSGRIRVESKLGKGSTFHFTVLLKRQDKPRVRSSPIDFNRLRSVTALIVDDNSLNRKILRSILSRWDMKATDVSDGRAALHVIRAASDIGHPFSVVLLDAHMRETDGFTLAEQMMKDQILVGATVMMLTSVGHVGDAARCRNLGVSAYLVKPVRPSELASAICLALEKTSLGEAAPLVTRHTLREVTKQMPRSV